jgi:hypothetical protein
MVKKIAAAQTKTGRPSFDLDRPAPVSSLLAPGVLTALKMEAVSTSETYVSFYNATLSKIPKDGHLHTRRLENLKSHTDYISHS